MGELRAYAVDLAQVRALFTGGPEQRDRVVALVRAGLPPTAAPAPLGPVFRRVPGAAVVRTDDPGPADLDRLLGGGAVPADRVAATWRLVEAVVAGLATSSTRTTAPRPEGLGPLEGLVPLPPDAGRTAGVWAEAGTRTSAPVTGWAAALPAGTDVVVFYDEGDSPGR